MRILIVGTSYINTDLKFKMFKLWEKIVNQFDTDILLMDSNSPYFEDYDWSGWDFNKVYEYDIFNFQIKNKKTIISYSENLGHVCSPPQKDAWGRSLCQALSAGVSSGYDRIIHIEYDMFWLKSLELLIPDNLNAVGFFGITYPGMIESGIMSFTSNSIINTNFISNYDWVNSSMSFLPELKIHHILNNNIDVYRDKLGARIEGNISDNDIISNIDNWYFITHCNETIIDFLTTYLFERKNEI